MSKLRNSHIKNIIVIFLLVFTSTNCYSCKKENTPANNPKAVEISNDYTEIPISKKKIKEDDKSIIYELKTTKNEIFLLVLDVEKENATLEINNQQILTDFNFTYDISEADAIREIKILVNPNGNIIFLLPVATEEFLTFQILKFDKARNKFFESNFFFETHDNIHDLYLKSKANLSETNNEYRLKIGSFEFKGSFEKMDTVTAEYNLLLDLNFDGVKEEFLVDFHQNTINSSKSIDKNIFFEANNVLIIQKNIEDNNPHDFLTYKYYLKNSGSAVVLDKIDFKREAYVETYTLCNFNFTYFSPVPIHFSEVFFFDKNFLQGLIRKIDLDQAIEITSKTNNSYQCTSNLTTQELDFLLTVTLLNDTTVKNYNDLAYYLEQNKQYETSSYLLSKITDSYPKRIVAWLNLGDALWGKGEREKAKVAYKTYVKLMRDQKKDLSKIPQRVYERNK